MTPDQYAIIVGWVAPLISVNGIYLNAKKNIRCWPIWITSATLWCLYSFLTSKGINTAVINPLLISNFSKLSLRKTKTDKQTVDIQETDKQ